MTTDNPPITPPPPSIPTPRKRWGWKSWLLATVIFLAGFFSGSGATVVVAIRKVQMAIQHPDEARARLALHLARRLDLTDKQTIQVQEIMERRQRAMVDIRRDVQPRIEAELESMRNEVSGVLNAQQRDQWERMYDEVRQNWLPRLPAPVRR